jgi:conjugative transfer pilus assembly protein TraH
MPKQDKLRRLKMKPYFSMSLIVTLAFFLFGISASSRAGWADDWWANTTVSGPASYDGQKRNYYTAGQISARWDMSNDHLFSVQRPRIKNACGGIDMFLGGASMLDADYLVQKFQNILQAAPALAFQMALSHFCKDCAHYVEVLEGIINQLNGIQVNDCRLANQLVRVASKDDPTSKEEVLREMNVDVGFWKGLYKNFHQGGQADPAANGNQATSPILVDGTANCPSAVKDLFKAGSVVDHASARVGSSLLAPIMKGYIGDVTVTPVGNTLEFHDVSFCPQNNTFEDFVIGRSYARNGANACVRDSTLSVQNEVRTNLVGIAGKMRSGAALSVAENALIQQSPFPVYAMLKKAVTVNAELDAISSTDRLIAQGIGFAMATDLFRHIDYVLAQAKAARGVTTVDDPAKQACQWSLYEPGYEKLNALRERAWRLRESLWTQYAQTARDDAALRAIDTYLQTQGKKAQRELMQGVAAKSGAK